MTPIRIRLREWQTLGPQDERGRALRGLTLAGKEPRALAERLARAGIIDVSERHDGVRVATFAHVGRIQVDPLIITIEPKIGQGELLELLRYAYGLRDLWLFEQVPYASTGQLLQDLIVRQLVAEVTELVERGLARRYVERAERLASPRGRMDLNALAGRGPIVDARIDCRHHERATDHLLNQVLLSGLALARTAASDVSLRTSLSRLARRLADGITPVPIHAAMLARAWRRLDRMTEVYAPALRLIELLHSSTALSLEDETSVELQGFLFDMNRFFQALLARFLQEHLEVWTVEEEVSLHGMMRYLKEANPQRRKAPTPRPDFVIRDGKRIAAILDAKYRDLWERDLPREMLYQLAMYAMSQPAPFTSAILYPTMTASAVESVVEIRDPLGTRALGFVALRPVRVDKLVAAIRSGDGQHMARRLVEQTASLSAAASQAKIVREGVDATSLARRDQPATLAPDSQSSTER